MTERAINLYDGLEALYYFDSSYFDGTANEVKDKSGYNKHAQARGAPTIGVSGPQSFEAASFDGSDDGFETDFFKPESEFTITIRYKISQHKDFNRLWDNGGSVNFYLTNEGGLRIFIWDDADTRYQMSGGIIDTGKWYNSTLLWDGADVHLYVNNELISTIDGFGDTVQETNQVVFLGMNSNISNYLNGSMVYSGWWSRALNYSELTFLNNMTSPRRQLL